MNLSKEDKAYLVRALETEKSRVKRAMNSAANLSIKEILQKDFADLESLSGRLFNEVAK